MSEHAVLSRRRSPLARIGAFASLVACLAGCEASADDEDVPDCEVTSAAATESAPAPSLDFAWADIETVRAFDVEGVLAEDQLATASFRVEAISGPLTGVAMIAHEPSHWSDPLSCTSHYERSAEVTISTDDGTVVGVFNGTLKLYGTGEARWSLSGQPGVWRDVPPEITRVDAVVHVIDGTATFAIVAVEELEEKQQEQGVSGGGKVTTVFSAEAAAIALP